MITSSARQPMADEGGHEGIVGVEQRPVEVEDRMTVLIPWAG